MIIISLNIIIESSAECWHPLATSEDAWCVEFQAWLELIAEINANCRNYSLPVPGPSNNYPPRVLIQIAHWLPRLWDAHHLLLPGQELLLPRSTSDHHPVLTTAHQHLCVTKMNHLAPFTPLDFVWPKEDGWPWPIGTNWDQLETLGATPKTQLIEVFSCLQCEHNNYSRLPCSKPIWFSSIISKIDLLGIT